MRIGLDQARPPSSRATRTRTYRMFPELFRIGDFVVTSFGVMMFLSFIAGAWFHALTVEKVEHLLRHAGQVVTRTMLLEKVWDYHFDPQTNVIDVHVSRLRQKVDKGFDKPLIHTVRNAGYMYVPAASAPPGRGRDDGV
mgnify:CR=1 FL=1